MGRDDLGSSAESFVPEAVLADCERGFGGLEAVSAEEVAAAVVSFAVDCWLLLVCLRKVELRCLGISSATVLSAEGVARVGSEFRPSVSGGVEGRGQLRPLPGGVAAGGGGGGGWWSLR